MKALLFLSVLFVSSVGTVLPAAEVRQALVMGVWDYSDPKFPALPGIEADVGKMTAKLRELGFTVSVVTNPTLSQAKDAVDDFGAKLKTGGEAGVGLFYFSGHGSEHDGTTSCPRAPVSALVAIWMTKPSPPNASSRGWRRRGTM